MSIPIEINLPDAEWTCRWVSGFRYQKDARVGGITVSCKVAYATKEGTIKQLDSPLSSLHNTIAGSRLEVKNRIATPKYNSQQNRKLYIIDVPQEFASNEAEPLHTHLNLTDEQYYAYSDDLEYLSLAQGLQFPVTFGSTYAHCIPATKSNPTIDFFIIPSYEVLRHFFLLGSKLPTQLLSYFTGEGERATQSISELVTHPTGSPLIISHQEQRIGFLNIKEGVSELEKKCLARIAYIPQAFTCLELIKSSLLLSSLDKGFESKTLRTILPQNKSFKIAACGRKFKWQEKIYVIIDQIYDTNEEMPFDYIYFNPILDHRSKARKPGEVAETTKRESRAKVKPTDSYRITATEPGDNSQAAEIPERIETDYSFLDKPIITFNKLPKKNQKGHYSTTITTQEYDRIATLEEAFPGATAGRGSVTRQDKPQIKTYDPQHSKVKPFFEALTSLKNYTCDYLNFDQATPFFSNKYYLNHARLGSPYRVLLCLLKPLHEGVNTHIYVVWSGTIRYAVFYISDLGSLPLSLLTEICSKHFSKYGVNSEWKEEDTKQYRQYLESYAKYNPAGAKAAELAKRIEKQLTTIYKHNKPTNPK